MLFINNQARYHTSLSYLPILCTSPSCVLAAVLSSRLEKSDWHPALTVWWGRFISKLVITEQWGSLWYGLRTGCYENSADRGWLEIEAVYNYKTM